MQEIWKAMNKLDGDLCETLPIDYIFITDISWSAWVKFL